MATVVHRHHQTTGPCLSIHPPQGPTGEHQWKRRTDRPITRVPTSATNTQDQLRHTARLHGASGLRLPRPMPGHVRLHIAPELGGTRLDKLTVRQARARLNGLSTTCQCCAQGKDAARPAICPAQPRPTHGQTPQAPNRTAAHSRPCRRLALASNGGGTGVGGRPSLMSVCPLLSVAMSWTVSWAIQSEASRASVNAATASRASAAGTLEPVPGWSRVICSTYAPVPCESAPSKLARRS